MFCKNSKKKTIHNGFKCLLLSTCTDRLISTPLPITLAATYCSIQPVMHGVSRLTTNL